ncbi:MAG: PrgI family mobile element protein [Clostridia bacterium]
MVADNKKQVKIPRQIRLKTEFFIGFGMEELIKTLIVGAIAGIIAYILYKITGQTIISTLIVIGAIVVSVVSLIKGNNNFSMVDVIKNYAKFEFMQKLYKYERSNKH